MAQLQALGVTGSMSFRDNVGCKNSLIGECSSIYACNDAPECHISIGECIYPDASHGISTVTFTCVGSGWGAPSQCPAPCAIFLSQGDDNGKNAYLCITSFSDSGISSATMCRYGVRYSGCSECICVCILGGCGTGATACVSSFRHSFCNIGIGNRIGEHVPYAYQNISLGNDHMFLSGSNQTCYLGPTCQFPNGGVKEVSSNITLGNCILRHPQIGVNYYSWVNDNVFLGRNISYRNVASYCSSCGTCMTQNVAIGLNTMKNTWCSYNNIAIGTNALEGCSTYSSQCAGNVRCCNIAIGACSLRCQYNSYFNIGMGTCAVAGGSLNLSSDINIGIGHYSIYCLTTGDFNIAIGCTALFGATTANCLIGIGKSAARCVTAGTRSVFIGDCAGYCQSEQHDTIAIGPNAMWRGQSTQGGHIAIGADALRSICGGYLNLAVGYGAMYVGGSNTSTCAINGGCNTAIGTYAGKCVKGASAANIFIGFESGPNTCTAISCTFYLGSGLGNHLMCGCLASSGRTLCVNGSFAATSKNFAIPHPSSTKTETHVLYHSAVESPTAGDNLYRFEVEVENGTATIDLPDYYKHLNENDQVWVNAKDHFGRAYGVVDQEQTTLTVFADTDGEYNVLLLGTRKDKDAVKAWKGTERLKGK